MSERLNATPYKRVAMTTSIPVEVIFGANCVPVDLNNVFINHENPLHLIGRAEKAGFPHTVCAWIKGIFGVLLEDADLNTVVAVTQGDCSNTHALMDVLTVKGKEIVPFEFPYDRNYSILSSHIESLINRFNTGWEQAMEAKKRLDAIRRKLVVLDELTWRENKVSGLDNHLFLVSSSDFNSNPEKFEKELDEFLERAEKRVAYQDQIRLGYVGVPPIFSGLYEYLETLGARVVFNEIQRQFSMPYLVDNLVEQYLLYTYPYGIFSRLQDIQDAIETRKIDGIIHYTQSFCFRQIQDIVLREKVKIPILTLEGENPGILDDRTKTRIETFVDMLR
jgi:benzoyl-CoA reductase/2-hydroxyglutaryl-CoA dehydratase subunit BcrC/BadD/HgdB